MERTTGKLDAIALGRAPLLDKSVTPETADRVFQVVAHARITLRPGPAPWSQRKAIEAIRRDKSLPKDRPGAISVEEPAP